MVVDCGRKFTIAEYEKSADEFAKKRFGSAGNLPPRVVEVRVMAIPTLQFGSSVQQDLLQYTAYDQNHPTVKPQKLPPSLERV